MQSRLTNSRRGKLLQGVSAPSRRPGGQQRVIDRPGPAVDLDGAPWVLAAACSAGMQLREPCEPCCGGGGRLLLVGRGWRAGWCPRYRARWAERW